MLLKFRDKMLGGVQDKLSQKADKISEIGSKIEKAGQSGTKSPAAVSEPTGLFT